MSRVGILGTLTRAIYVAACAGCAAPAAESIVLRGSDRVVGRAALGQHVMMLTNEPALIRIMPEQARLTRQPISARDRARPKLWGLAQADGRLYSINEFKRLVRLEAAEGETQIRDVAPLDRAAGNLFDTASGIGLQFAVADPGQPLAAQLDESGSITALAAPARASLGLARAEEGLLHLLTCSVPPRVLCWTPGSNELLVVDDRGIRPLVRLDAIPRIAPSLLIARPTARAIQDALWVSGDHVLVLFQDGNAASPVLAEFSLAGRMVKRLQPPQPLRLLVAANGPRVLAITQSGLLTEVAR